jgi:hypothetical protein
MHVLIGLGAAVALLYFWLLGHWFARVLVFLFLVLCAGYVGLIVNKDGDGAAIAGTVVFIIGAILSWPIASIPIVYWRHRLGIA